jgi:hypothetical protein
MKPFSFKTSVLVLCLIATIMIGSSLFSFSELRGAVTATQADQVFFENLHSHSSYSDGLGTPDEAYEHARDAQNAKLDFMALTGHNHAEALSPDGVGIATQPALFKGSDPDSLISTARRLTEDGRFVALNGRSFRPSVPAIMQTCSRWVK